MKPSDELIEKFRQTYIQEFGEEMSTPEAEDNLISLVGLLRIILRPLPKKQDGNLGDSRHV
jgi:hypothetical protein